MPSHHHPAKDSKPQHDEHSGDKAGANLARRRDGRIRRLVAVGVLAGVGVTLGGAARLGRDRAVVWRGKERYSGSEDAHLLAGTGARVGSVGAGAPVEAALATVGTARTLLGGQLGGRFEQWVDRLCQERRHLHGVGVPAMEVALEGEHVCGAGVARLARGLVRGAVLEEEALGTLYEAVEFRLPAGLLAAGCLSSTLAYCISLHLGRRGMDGCLQCCT